MGQTIHRTLPINVRGGTRVMNNILKCSRTKALPLCDFRYMNGAPLCICSLATSVTKIQLVMVHTGFGSESGQNSQYFFASAPEKGLGRASGLHFRVYVFVVTMNLPNLTYVSTVRFRMCPGVRNLSFPVYI